VTHAPLLSASPAIKLHAFVAMAALVLGVVQFWGPKGTSAHRAIGWAWVALMAAICLSAFWIHELRLWGSWSPIHLLAIFTLVTLPIGVLHARRHRVGRHRFYMISIFCGALVIAGIFTFVPGRIMYAVISGN
jgi:uncharacterized membrane protein